MRVFVNLPVPSLVRKDTGDGEVAATRPAVEATMGWVRGSTWKNNALYEVLVGSKGHDSDYRLGGVSSRVAVARFDAEPEQLGNGAAGASSGCKKTRFSG